MVQGPDLDIASITNAAALLRPLERFLGRNSFRIVGVSAGRLARGTSGARLYMVAVRVEGEPAPVRLILKVGTPGEETELNFYRFLAPTIPVATPRLIAHGRLEDRGWLLMEEIDARDDLTWTSFDYRLVVRDMAQLHAKYWGRTDFLTYDWLWRPEREALHLHMAGLAEVAEGVSGSWLEGSLPEMFGSGKLSLIRRVLAQYQRMIRPLNAPGLTLCHGDYWFHNVLLTRSGARLLIDWQGSRIWSGIWELAYFLNLLLAVSPGVYREMPVPEESIVRWYRQGLEAAGISISDTDFNRAFLAARVLHPLLHWLPMVGSSAGSEPYDIDEPTRRFLGHTFERWERDASALME